MPLIKQSPISIVKVETLGDKTSPYRLAREQLPNHACLRAGRDQDLSNAFIRVRPLPLPAWPASRPVATPSWINVSALFTCQGRTNGPGIVPYPFDIR